ncbi:MAG: hypothetical protein FJW39_29205 [Acidobacteria bacterium]|nr:hypothetical protein [Acidobacteriota bacterium]
MTFIESASGFFELGLFDVQGQLAHDSTTVRFLRGRDRRVLYERRDLAFPPRRVFDLPDFPEHDLICEVAPRRFRHCSSGLFTLTGQARVTQDLTLLRIPDKWNARFEPWGQLPGGFDPLKAVLGKSPGVRVIKGRTLGNFVEGAYDDADDDRTILAKASLLNVYAKASGLQEPTGTNRNWFSFITGILEIGRERIIARADPALAGIVERVGSRLDQYNGYRASENPEGHRKNVPKPFRSRVRRVFSIKSGETNAVLHITVFTTDDPSVVLVDLDIDENGSLWAHIADIFRHAFTGGTHPFDIHEYLLLARRDLELGYRLV